MLHHLRLPFVCWILCVTAASAQQVGFTEVSQEFGLNYTYTGSLYCQGVSFFDFNQDGLDDISFGGKAGESIFMLQSMGDSLVPFNASGINLISDVSKCVVWVDYDNDGDVDLCANNFGSYSKLFRNNGGLSFTDVTFSSGWSSSMNVSYGSVWADYNRDGFLDMYMGNRTTGFIDGYKNILLENDAGATFTNVTNTALVADSQGFAFGVLFTDFDKDLWPDIYVSNDKLNTTNTLFHNLGNGVFQNVSDEQSTGIIMEGMGVAAADFDNNGFEDIYVANTPSISAGDGNILCRNNGDGTFDEVAQDLEVFVSQNSWGVSWADFDNDGNIDLFVANDNASGQTSNTLFMNQGDGTFVEDTTTAIFQVSDRSYGSAVGVVNGDGYPDIVVMNQSPTTMKLWLNDGGTNNWVKLTLQGTVSNRQGVGAWIELYFDGQTRYRYTRCGTGYGSQDAGSVIMGVGQAIEVDSAFIYWPSGMVDDLHALEVNQTHLLVEGGLVTGDNAISQNRNMFSVYPNPVKESLSVDWLDETSSEYRLTLISANGKEYQLGSIQTLKGLNSK